MVDFCQRLIQTPSLPGEEGPHADDEGEEWTPRAGWQQQSATLLDELGDADELARALATLPEMERQAFILKLHGWKTHSQDPTEQTISTMLRRTDRQIRNYLRQAEERLRAWVKEGK